MKSYAIMHLDRHVATLRGDGSCTVYFPQFMPFNLFLERTEGADLDTRLNNINNFHYWCAARLLTPERRYAKEMLNALGLKQAVTDRERAQIALSYHALSLTDVFWVRELRQTLRYSEIALYDHPPTNAFVDVALRGRAPTAQNAARLGPLDTAGDLSTSGAAPKAWVHRDGRFLLLKDGDPRDVQAELVASRIARCFDVEQVLYEPGEYDGQVVSCSALMTDKARSIVPAEHMEIYAANHGTGLSRIVERLDARGFHMMNIIDYLVGNTDRHWGNWGFWVNNADNRPMKLHPLMDFNRSFRAYDSLEGARCLTVEGDLSQREAALRGVQAVGLDQSAPLPADLPGLFARLDEGSHAHLEDMFLRRLELLRSAAG